MQLTLTERAAEAVRSRAREADVPGWLLRIAVVAGGCSGLIYELYFVPEPSGEDLHPKGDSQGPQSLRPAPASWRDEQPSIGSPTGGG